MPIPLDNQICFTLYATSMAINRTYKPMLDEMGITYPQYLVLAVLYERDGQTVGAIAERLALESSTITPLVKRLEAAGLVGRGRNPEDERQVVVTITDTGRTLHHDMKCLSEQLLESSHLTVPDLIRLNADMKGLRDALSSDRA